MPEQMGKLLVTADLHFGLYPQGDECTAQLAEHVCGSGADVLAIAGDVADADVDYFAACLELFSGFGGPKLVVPGNHDLWTAGGGSERKYRELLPRIAADRGFRMLDIGPFAAGGIGFIGSIGWYDYSFRSEHISVSTAQYALKELPGICTWNDGRFIDWGFSDADFTEKCLRRLQAAYRAVEPTVHTVVAVLHHVPFRELLYGPSTPAHEFCRAYMGSERFGKLLVDMPKVRYVFCGHRHGLETHEVGGLKAFCAGSEYLVKRLLELDLETGEHEVRAFEPPGTDDARRPEAAAR